MRLIPTVLGLKLLNVVRKKLDVSNLISRFYIFLNFNNLPMVRLLNLLDLNG